MRYSKHFAIIWGSPMTQLYDFVYRGMLTDESLDKVGRKRRRSVGAEELEKLRAALSFDMLDQEFLSEAQWMSVVYTGIHAFENTVRQLVKKGLTEAHAEEWWSKVPERIQKKVKTRMDEDAKFRWHGSRGASHIHYTDFGDLSSIIVTNWDVFEELLSDMEWAKSVLSTLEKSRNIVMHGGVLAKEDIGRIGMNIRDWIRQAG